MKIPYRDIKASDGISERRNLNNYRSTEQLLNITPDLEAYIPRQIVT
jgi:hypothetical protein